MMLTRGVLVGLAAVIAATSCHSSPNYKQVRLARASTPACHSIYPVSIITLLGHPSQFEQECVAVRGFYQIGRVYLTRDHAEIGAHSDSISVRNETDDGAIARSACQSQYVFLVGRFSRSDDLQHDPTGEIGDLQEIAWIDLDDIYNRSEMCWTKHAQ
jgi:hypothetical protein